MATTATSADVEEYAQPLGEIIDCTALGGEEVEEEVDFQRTVLRRASSSLTGGNTPARWPLIIGRSN